MWVCQHKPQCNDQSRYTIVRERACIEDKDGNVLDANPSGSEEVKDTLKWGYCSDCRALAGWDK
ncbi:unnamed protein product [marine sediment metagenome]|uniref:Uncharacterized protein n=1 Tax=marine sediment metagenome TaxID=412755 RepID=X1T6B7_9ZZZZ